MGNRRENALKRLLRRRLTSSKGTVYFEFAVMMPLVMMVMLFAVDFTRCLYCEQQLEIASRVLADIQCHLNPGKISDSDFGSKIPNSRAKAPVRNYLANVLANEGLGLTGHSELSDAVYCKAEVKQIPTPFNAIFENIAKFLNGDFQCDNQAIRVIAKIISGVLNFLTFRTDKYFTQPLGRDLMVCASVSVVTQPLIKNAYWKTFFGTKHGTKGTSSMLLAPWKYRLSDATAAFDRAIIGKRRDRYYCTMPVLDTLPMCPSTYVKILKQKLKKFL